MVHLLDINVLLALVDKGHAHHHPAIVWFKSHRQEGWATCPFTENGFVRILSNPNHPSKLGNSAIPLQLLNAFRANSDHAFWSANVSLADILSKETAVRHRHITDLYLIGLAIHNGGKLATLDRRIPAELIPGGSSAMTLIPL